MVNQDDSTLTGYLMQQQFPARSYSGYSTNNLLIVQGEAPSVTCNIGCGNLTLLSSDKFRVRMQLVPSPVGSYFKVELQMSPSGDQNASTEQKQRHSEDRISATFSTYEDAPGDKFPDRQRYNYTSNNGNTPPPGPLSFSAQLMDVRFRFGDHPDVRKALLFKGNGVKDQLCFFWKAKRCTKFAFSRVPAHVSPDSRAAATTFRDIINLVIEKGMTLAAVTEKASLIPLVYWPWFAAIPAPVPESFFPWLNVLDPAKPLDIMQFHTTGDFELWSGYLDRALGVRNGRDWINKVEAKSSPNENLAQLPAVTSFRDPREYLAHVVGCYAYEELFAKKNLFRYYNGSHACDIIPNTGGPTTYIVLLNIRPPKKTTLAEAIQNQGLPEEGERVHINIVRNQMEQTWKGTVIRIPRQYLRYGRNVAVFAEPAPTTPSVGRILTPDTANADFHFGHYGSPTTPTIERLINLMTNCLLVNGQTIPNAHWLKNILLAQDNSGNVRNNYISADLPLDWEKQAERFCAEKRLNSEQRQALFHYFTHRLTVVRGPPGTGKSTLTDAILELEARFKSKVWLCTDSNAACDVLVRKMCRRLGNVQPVGFFRVKPAFEETLEVEFEGQSARMKSLPSLSSQQGNQFVTEAIQEYLDSREKVARAMSLQATILRRIKLVPDFKKGTAHQQWGWPNSKTTEEEDLNALVAAFVNFHQLRLEGMTAEDYTEEKQRLEKRFLGALRRVQRQYVAHAQGVFSTVAAASGPLLNGFKPNALIMDEASQFLEAKAVSAMIHAMNGKRLERILLVGDDKQLPPTLVAPRNPFSNTGQVSLFERLIKSGLPCIMLRTQFRMHPDISRVVNDEIYAQLGGLRDDASTSVGPDVAKFRNTAQGLAAFCGANNFPATNALVISPVEDPHLSWKATTPPGSTSRYNLVTARLIYKLAELLVNKGQWAAKDIMVICFYADQVQLLQSLFDGMAIFKGITVCTVDSSQGSESMIVIVDCVVLGAANGDGMGFLNEDRRRWNVAMSRAQKGRIVVAHENMIATYHAKETQAGPWNKFFAEAKDKKTIISGAKLNAKMESKELQARLEDVFSTWQAKSKASAKSVAHKNIIQKTTVEVKVPKNADFAYTTFIEVTGASVKDAKTYVGSANGEVHVAINRYFHDKGSDLPMEEV